jgi:hypothetical protein
MEHTDTIDQQTEILNMVEELLKITPYHENEYLPDITMLINNPTKLMRYKYFIAEHIQTFIENKIIYKNVLKTINDYFDQQTESNKVFYIKYRYINDNNITVEIMDQTFNFNCTIGDFISYINDNNDNEYFLIEYSDYDIIMLPAYLSNCLDCQFSQLKHFIEEYDIDPHGLIYDGNFDHCTHKFWSNDLFDETISTRLYDNLKKSLIDGNTCNIKYIR